MSDTYTTYRPGRTPQSKQASPKQTKNHAGGYTFTVTPEQRVRRFLTIGSAGGTYYVNADDLTRDNATALVDMASTPEGHKQLVDIIVDVSTRGAAPKQQPGLFALALASSIGETEGRRYALAQLPAVARTASTLFTFVKYLDGMRSWGRAVRTSVGSWYTSKTTDDLAYQIVKYRQRDGWSHRHVLRQAHPNTDDPEMSALFQWIIDGTDSPELPRIIDGFRRAQAGDDPVKLISEFPDMSWEMFPDTALNTPGLWDALLDAGMPQTALIRQLPRLTRLGLLPAMGGRTAEVASLLTDGDRLRKGRVHPMSVLVAQRTYAAGRGQGSEWVPNQKIVDALDRAFYKAFGAVKPAGKRTMLALDISGSMAMHRIGGLPITPREASAALALVRLATEPEAAVYGFSSKSAGISRYGMSYGWGPDEFIPLSISPRQRLDDAVRAVSNLPFGGTDCSLPMQYAKEHDLEVDTFEVYTDSETWHGSQHPHEALRDYRKASGIDAKLIVVGMTATDVTIADPDDPGMLDVAGFDTAVPNVISDFSAGKF